jgi:hypothetical protein
MSKVDSHLYFQGNAVFRGFASQSKLVVQGLTVASASSATLTSPTRHLLEERLFCRSFSVWTITDSIVYRRHQHNLPRIL